MEQHIRAFAIGRAFIGIDSSDGNAHLICVGHLPKNIVIFDPVTGVCRNRDGSYTWREDEPGMVAPYVAPNDTGKLDDAV